MNKLDKEQHIALLKDAIAANLRARHDLRMRIPARSDPQLKFIDFSKSETQLHLESIIEHAAITALQAQMSELGKELFRVLGSTDAMLPIAEEVANRHGNWGININIIDKNWNGIGAGNDRWWA